MIPRDHIHITNVIMIPIVYIAGPFRASTAWDVECNIRAAENVALEVAMWGAMPLCPHTNTRFFHGLLNDDFWLEGTLELLRRCDAVVVVRSWKDSAGTRREIEEAKTLGKPILFGVDGLPGFIEDLVNGKEHGD